MIRFTSVSGDEGILERKEPGTSINCPKLVIGLRNSCQPGKIEAAIFQWSDPMNHQMRHA
jgi:hypothetical protein